MKKNKTSVFVHTKTGEIVDHLEDYFVCDKDIAATLSLLWKKGYRTYASCAGRNRKGYSEEVFEASVEQLPLLREQGDFIRILKVTSEHVYFKQKILGDSVYISFSEFYDFPFLPKGFQLEKDEDGMTLCSYNPYYKEDYKTRRSDMEIELQLFKARVALYQWVLELENRKQLVK